MSTQTKLASFMGVLALALLYLLPGLLFSYKSVQEPWTLFRLARVSLALPAGHLQEFSGAAAAYRGEHLGGELLQAALVRLTGWPLEWIALLPLGALLLPALTFAVIRVTSRSTWLAFWLSLFGAWYYPRLFSHYGVQTYVWTDALFLCFALLLWLWLRRPSALLSGLLLAVFLAAFLHYQTTPLWMIVACASAVLLGRWRRALYPQGVRPPSWALPLVFVVIYLQFDTVFYGNFLGHLRSEPVDRLLIANLIAKVLAPLAGRQPATLGEFAAAPLSPRLATWSTLLAILMLSLPLLVWCLVKLRRAIRAREAIRLVERLEDIFIWSLLAVTAAHALLYSVYGALSLRLIDLAFPLLLPLAFFDFPGGRRMASRLAPALALCAAIGFVSYATALRPDILAGETGLVDDLLAGGRRLLADANTFGGLSLNAARDGRRLELAWLDAEAYAWLAGRRPAARPDFDYLVTDNQGKGVISQGWVFFAPWVDNLAAIDRNAGLDLIYASGAAQVYQPAGKALPEGPKQPGDYHLPALAFWTAAARLLPALFVVLVAPGVVLAVIVMPGLSPPVEQRDVWAVLLVLSAGLSLAVNTFVGYLANASPPGLGWAVPLTIAFTFVCLAVLVGPRRPRPVIPASLFLPIAAGVLLWALAAAGVAGYRTQARQPGAEFYLTADGSTGGQVFVNVVNREDRSLACRLVYAGIGGRVSVSISLPPGAAWRVPVSLPTGPQQVRLAFNLACDRRGDLTLHLSRPPPAQAGGGVDELP